MVGASCSPNENSSNQAASGAVNLEAPPQNKPAPAALLLGAQQKEMFLPLLRGKRVGLIVNHTSLVPQPGGDTLHLVDLLIREGIQVQKVFSPEHGFRGTADAGEKVASGTDAQTGLPLVSLYGSNKKPSPEQLLDVDVLLFDIQDVGARFYTYISTMHYAMEAAAEQGKEVVVLDRPNPNGHIIDGPMLQPEFRSFVGMHPIPVIHGLTVAELAQMINGEGWLAGEKQAKLTVIPMANYTHSTPYKLPVPPSPNLPNQQSVLLYPSLCLFEGTPLSLGRGTPFPFQVIGYPDQSFGSFSFTPKPMPGAKNPPLEGKECWGMDLRAAIPPNHLDLSFVIKYYKLFPDKEKYFQKFFHTLAGTDQLAAQIRKGMSEEAIRASWQPALDDYRTMRLNYLLY
ncbi:MAG: DUF1343 domain-containing protein, partial [Bacteroidetes bacterium]|nr:DUF1343 domain-containing protein [Bacteroidota bacterium]